MAGTNKQVRRDDRFTWMPGNCLLDLEYEAAEFCILLAHTGNQRVVRTVSSMQLNKAAMLADTRLNAIQAYSKE